MRGPGAAHKAYEPMTPVRMEKIRNRTRIAVAVAVGVPVVLFLGVLFYGGWQFCQYALAGSRSISGEAALKAGDYDRAIRDLEFAERYYPNWSHNRYMLGVAYIKNVEERANTLPPDDRRRLSERLAAITESVESEPEIIRDGKRNNDVAGSPMSRPGKTNP